MNRFRGRSGAGSAPAHGSAPQNLSPDKHVDGCVDSDEDRGSIPLASTLLIINDLSLAIGDRRDLKDLGALRKNASLHRELDIWGKHALNQLRANGY